MTSEESQAGCEHGRHSLSFEGKNSLLPIAFRYVFLNIFFLTCISVVEQLLSLHLRHRYIFKKSCRNYNQDKCKIYVISEIISNKNSLKICNIFRRQK